MIRHVDSSISSHFKRYDEILVLLGARQVGKTTIVNKLFPKARYLTVDEEIIKRKLERYDSQIYKQLFGDSKVIIIDEIQKISDPGRAAKIIHDQLPNYKLIITGSSSFRIKNKTGESLAGRKIDYYLYPLTLSEYLVQMGIEKNMNLRLFEDIIGRERRKEVVKSYDYLEILNDLLIYGLYPATIKHNDKTVYLKNLVDSVIFKDLTDLSLLENKSAALNLLKLLAYQIGSLVNFNELSSRLKIDTRTIKRYIELFEQSFIIFRLPPYSNSKRNEISKMPKIYFYDVGLRNALIENYHPIEIRNDSGVLFENFVISELYKYNAYGNFEYHFNFWRTKNGSEVDLVLSKTGEDPLAIEIKNKTKRVNTAFKNRYPKSKFTIISKENYWV